MTYHTVVDLSDLEAILGPRCPKSESARDSAKSQGTKIKATQAIIDRSTGSGGFLDLPLEVSLYDSLADTTPKHKRLSLRQLVERIQGVKASHKADLPLLKLGTFEGGRKAEHLVSRHGIEIDYDAGEVNAVEAANRLRAANVAALVFTTSRHTPDAPRWRVLVPTARPVSPAETTALVERVNGALGGIAGKESFEPARCYFYGGIRDKASPEVHLIEGRAVDLASELPRIAIVKYAEHDLSAEPDDDDLFRDRPIDWERIRAALRAVKDASDRETWLQIGMALHHESRGESEGFDLWCKWSKRCPEKFNLRSQQKTWASFGKRTGRAVGIGTLFDLAKRCGWEAAPATDYQAELADLLGRPREPVSRLNFLSPSDCETAPPRGYVLKGFLAPGDVGSIVGAPGAGKSLLAPFLGYAVAQGREVFGMRSKVGGVLYVAAEDPHGMSGRVKALKQAHGDAPQFKLVTGVSDLLSPDSPDLLDLLSAAETMRPALIVVDTLAMAFPGLEENSAESMGRVVAVARSLTRWGAAVVLVHHDTKDGAQGLPRGHSILNGALDVAMHVKRDEFGTIRGRLTKNRNGACDRDIAFTIATENGGTDEDGEPITLPRCNPFHGSPIKVKRLSPQVAEALKLLEGLQQPVSRDEWKRVCMASDAVCANEKPDTRRKAFDRALEVLSRDGWIKSHDGFYSIDDGFDDWDGHGQSSDISGMSDKAKRHSARTDTDISL